MLLVSSGCAISIEPAWHPRPRNDPNNPPIAPGNPGVPGKGMPPLPPPTNPPGIPGTAADQMSLMMQRMQNLEDDRKAMTMRLTAMETQLREKEQAVSQAGYEVQSSAMQMRKSREDLQQWKLELTEMRNRIRTIEQENRLTVEVLIKALEQFVEKDPGKTRQ
jgi:TolA-binding protein